MNVFQSKKDRQAKLKQIVSRGDRALRVKSDLDVILTEMRNTLYSNLESSAWYDRKERDEIARQLKTLRGIEKQIAKQVEDGLAAQDKLDNNLRSIV